MPPEANGEELEYITPDTGMPDETTEPAVETADDGDDLDLELTGDDLDDPDKPDEPSEEEFEEIEHSGKKYKIPKDVKPLLMMQADYTRKTQEVAEQRRAIEQGIHTLQEREQAIVRQAEAQKQNIQGYAHLVGLDQQLEHYAKVDWQAYEMQDPLTANSQWRQYQQLKEARTNIATHLQRQEHQAQTARQQQEVEAQRAQEAGFAKAVDQTVAELKRDFKDWNGETETKVIEYALANGATKEQLRQAADKPLTFKLLYKALKYDQLVEKKKAAKAQPTDDAKPLTSVTRGRTAPAPSGLDDRLSADEWARRRNKQIRERG